MAVLIDQSDVRLEVTDRGLFFVTPRASGRRGTDELLDLIQPHLVERAPVRYLVDARGLADLPLADRWKLSRRMKDNRPHIARSAVFGLGAPQRFMLQVILRASGRDDLRAFERREEAEDWLLSEDP